jgi:hypothetical protein
MNHSSVIGIRGLFVVGVVVMCMSGVARGQYNATTSDMDKNWIVTKGLKRDESVSGVSKQYFDSRGAASSQPSLLQGTRRG